MRTIDDLISATGVAQTHRCLLAADTLEHLVMLPRLELLSHLKERSLPLPVRQKLANAIEKAKREGRLQPDEDEEPTMAPSGSSPSANAPRNVSGGFRLQLYSAPMPGMPLADPSTYTRRLVVVCDVEPLLAGGNPKM